MITSNLSASSIGVTSNSKLTDVFIKSSRGKQSVLLASNACQRLAAQCQQEIVLFNRKNTTLQKLVNVVLSLVP